MVREIFTDFYKVNIRITVSIKYDSSEECLFLFLNYHCNALHYVSPTVKITKL